MMFPAFATLLRAGTWLGAFLALMPCAFGGDFVINPLRLTLDRSNLAGEVLVRNDDRTPLRMQVEAMSWRQDETGKDQYGEARGLLYFPRVLEIPPGESRIVRVGTRAAPVSREETYRLFLEELPAPSTAQSEGTTLQVLLRVGVAVFVAPSQRVVKGAISQFEVTRRHAEWTVVNEGNVHIRAEQAELAGYTADGSRILNETVQERYFLAGVAKKIAFDIPPELCRRLAALEVSVVAEKLELRRKLDVEARACD